VLICVKSKHGCSSGMMSWTYVVEIFISICKLPNKKKVIHCLKRRRLIVENRQQAIVVGSQRSKRVEGFKISNSVFVIIMAPACCWVSRCISALTVIIN